MKNVFVVLALLSLMAEIYALPTYRDNDQSEEKRPTPLKWNPEESLAFLQSALEGARVEESHEKDTEKVIEATDKYIVVFKEEATTQDVDLHKETVKEMSGAGQILHEYAIGNDFRGYSISMTNNKAAEIAMHPSVKYVEKSEDGHTNYCSFYQPNAPWGLVRSSARHYTTSNECYFYSNDGSGVNVYVIDSGIDTTHTNFYGCAIWGYDTLIPYNSPKIDDHGHGTHVAGTVISWTYGIAKRATAIAVRTCYKDPNGRGAICPGPETVAAVNWVANQHKPGDKSIVNMSLGWKNGYKALDDAIRAAINKGIHFAVSAGNAWVDACTQSPARVTEAVTVSAINNKNEAYYNYGNCVDISAPGVDVESTLPNQSTGIWSGTSMATPHVAGAMALILQYENLSPAQMKARLQNTATKNQIKSLKPGTPNSILYVSC